MNIRWALILGALCGATACTDRLEVPQPGHPIVGAWSYAVPRTQCVETYEFLQDGVRRYTSGLEKGESAFRITSKPKDGFYSLEDTTTSTNGGTSCSGSPATPVGDRVEVYVHFNSPAEMALCFEKSLEDCIGPFKKVGT